MSLVNYFILVLLFSLLMCLIYNMKNFTIKKSLNGSRNLNKKHYSNQFSSLFLSKASSQCTSSSPSTSSLKQFQAQIKQIWEMADCMGIQISQQSIIKYMRKVMLRNNYKYTDFITENYSRNRSKLQGKTQEINFEHLLYQVGKIKTQIQDFIYRKFVKQISIMEEMIHKQDELIRDSLQLNQYQYITASFRPSLISNPTDLLQELQTIGRRPNKRLSSKLQQMRYSKLARSQRNICNLHSMVCQMKQGAEVQNY